jgi:SAM-dependent methyltransferase
MNIPDYVCCPECRLSLVEEDDAVRCKNCGASYTIAASGQIDLRPQRAFTKTLPVVVEPSDPVWSKNNGSPDATLRNFSVNNLDQITPCPTGPDSCALEIGCGGRMDVRNLLEHKGYRWVGVDYSQPMATYLVDAHALPFKDNTFPLVASDAFLEHVRYPHAAIREMARVLQPGGTIVGEVAFLQPFHDSYYHMTHEGILDLMRYAGLDMNLYANGVTSSFLYLAKHAFPRWAWLAWPADRFFRALFRRQSKNKRDPQRDIDFACTILFAAKKPL